MASTTAFAFNILIVTSQSADAETLTRILLDRAEDGTFHVEWVNTLYGSLERLQRDGFHVILLDLSLPDNKDISTFNDLFRAPPHVPIMLICSPEEEILARQAIRRGAEGFLSKQSFG